MSNAYAAVSALIFTVVAIMHVFRVINRWSVAIGPYNVSMTVIVGCPCRFCPARNLGLHAVTLMPHLVAQDGAISK